MVSHLEKLRSADLGPSPPLSTSDCEQDANNHPRGVNDGRHARGDRPVREREGLQRPQQCLEKTRQAGTDSSPLSASSTSTRISPSPTVPSDFSSFSFDHKQEEEEPRGRASGRFALQRGRGVDRAFHLIKAAWQGALPYDESLEWCELRVPPPQFLDLCQRLECYDPKLLFYFENLLRCDYNPSSSILVLRLMESATHGCLESSVVFYLGTQLQLIATKDPHLSTLISDIIPRGHTTFRLNTDAGQAYARKSPDGQLFFRRTSQSSDSNRPYRFEGSHLPPFLIEVGFSQGATSLERLAQEYYEESDGQIKTVLTIDIKYVSPAQRRSNPKFDRTAVFSLYRGPERIHQDTVFRNASGNLVPASLQLFLADFIPDQVLEQLDSVLRKQAEETTLELPSQLLCQYLETAEDQQRVEDAVEQGPSSKQGTPTTRPSSRKRKSVHWGAVHSRHDSPGSGNHSDEKSSEAEGQRQRSPSASRSKRRRTVDKPYHGSRSASASAGLPERRRTRSMTRSGGA